jgi:hypothetical protein
MRGIERVLAGILLVAAVCGAAAFARGLGRAPAPEPSASELRLAAPAPQHARSPGTIRIPLFPPLVRQPGPGQRPAAHTPPAHTPPAHIPPAHTPPGHLPAAPALRVAAPVLRVVPVSRPAARPVPKPSATGGRLHLTTPVVRHVPDIGAPQAPAPAPPAPLPAPAPAAPAPAPAAPAQQDASRVLASSPPPPPAATPDPPAKDDDGHGDDSPRVTVVVPRLVTAKVVAQGVAVQPVDLPAIVVRVTTPVIPVPVAPSPPDSGGHGGDDSPHAWR